MDSQTNRNYEQEIDLKDLMFAVLRKWRGIIMIAVVFAVLLGGFKTVKGLRQLGDEAYVKTNQEAYELSLSQHETTKNRLEKEVQNIQTNIQEQREYTEKSTLMNINPYDEYVASATLYVDTEYQIMPQMVYQNQNPSSSILKAYMAIAQNGEMYNYVLKNIKNSMSVRYLKELVTVEADYDNHILSIRVIGKNQAQADNLMKLIMESITGAEDALTENIGAHTISVVESSSFVTVDLELEQLQKDYSLKMEQLDNSLAEKTKALNELKEPASSLLSKRSVLAGAIKYAILGGVLGAFMMVFFICVAFLMSDNLTGDKELRRRYNLMVLGAFKREQKKKAFAFVDKWLDKIEGASKRELEDSQTCGVIAANLLNYVEDAKLLLLVGTVETSELERIRQEIGALVPGLTLKAGGDLCKDAEAIKSAAACDGIVVVEKRGESSLGSIEQELDLIFSLDKKVLGFIVL